MVGCSRLAARARRFRLIRLVSVLERRRELEEIGLAPRGGGVGGDERVARLNVRPCPNRSHVLRRLAAPARDRRRADACLLDVDGRPDAALGRQPACRHIAEDDFALRLERGNLACRGIGAARRCRPLVVVGRHRVEPSQRLCHRSRFGNGIKRGAVHKRIRRGAPGDRRCRGGDVLHADCRRDVGGGGGDVGDRRRADGNVWRVGGDMRVSLGLVGRDDEFVEGDVLTIDLVVADHLEVRGFRRATDERDAVRRDRPLEVGCQGVGRSGVEREGVVAVFAYVDFRDAGASKCLRRVDGEERFREGRAVRGVLDIGGNLQRPVAVADAHVDSVHDIALVACRRLLDRLGAETGNPVVPVAEIGRAESGLGDLHQEAKVDGAGRRPRAGKLPLLGAVVAGGTGRRGVVEDSAQILCSVDSSILPDVGKLESVGLCNKDARSGIPAILLVETDRVDAGLLSVEGRGCVVGRGRVVGRAEALVDTTLRARGRRGERARKQRRH